MNYTFHWRQAFQALPDMLGGARVTIEIAVLSMVIGVACAVALALARNLKVPTNAAGGWPGRRWLYRLARGFATAWIETARNTPSLFQIYMTYFGLGTLGIFVDSFPALLAGISFNNAGYLAETLRGGLRAIPPTQMRAARSLGMSAPQAFRLIVLPQLFRTVFHPMTNQMVWAILMTSLGVVVGLNSDLTGVTNGYNVRTFRTFEFFVMAAVIYYLITKVVTLSARLVASRLFRY
jgi:ABC-type amino acid transport system permease subunit